MGEQIDFAELYQHIGAAPGCSLDEFQLAYRRRVAVLHPDRVHGNADQLARLNALYAAAMEFHRQSGRLPGARRNSQAAHREVPRRAAAPATPEARVPRRHPWLLAGAITALLIWAVSSRPPTPMPPGDELDRAEHAPAPGTLMAGELGLGMIPAAVQAIEGEPVYKVKHQWHYGPSWIEFRCGVVDDWYSSPLRPLHVRNPRPLTDAGRGAGECEDNSGQEPRL